MQQPLYGLIGGKLGHSYSKIIHEQIADYTYDLLPLPTEAEARAFMEKRAFAAINVTIPYKQLVIPYCDEVDPKAKAIGAVNTIVNRDGKLYGYNTDYAGFAYLAKAHGVDFADKTVLILGTGGASKAVYRGLANLGIESVFVSRTKKESSHLTYDELTPEIMQEYTIIVNCTPVGMYPKVDFCPDIPYDQLTPNHLLYDLLYNPNETLFMKKGEAHGAVTKNGLEMLLLQAFAAWEIWDK